MIEYRGLCIGGPNDKKFYIWNQPRFMVTEAPKILVPITTGKPPDMLHTLKQSAYVFHPLHDVSVSSLAGLWVHQTFSISEALDRVMSAYADAE